MNVLTVFNAMSPFIQGRSLSELFAAHFMQNLPYGRFSPHCCIVCGRTMDDQEMFPPDRLTPRAICPGCWAKLTSTLSRQCWVCGGDLGSKFDRQRSQRHDLHYRIHGGICSDYFSLVSVRALGYVTGIRDDTRRGRHQPYGQYDHAAVQPAYEAANSKQPGAFSGPAGMIEHQSFDSVDSLLKQGRKNQDDVEVVYLPRRNQGRRRRW